MPGLGVDETLTEQFLDNVIKQAERIGGVDCAPYLASVRHRLAIGAQRYGPEAWRDRDNIVELLEESPDVACYALFEYLKDLEDPCADSARGHHLFTAAVHGAIADWHARAARHCA